MRRFIRGLDTDVKDGVVQIMKKHGMYKHRAGMMRFVRESVNEERLKVGDKGKDTQGTVEIKKRDTRGMRGKQDDYEMVLHMKNGKKYSMGSRTASASAVTNIAKKWDKGVPSYMKHMRVESVELDEGFKVGDKVKAKKGSQAGSFRQYGAKVGTIVKDYKDGDFKVNFGGSNDASIAGKDLVKESVDLDEKNVWRLALSCGQSSKHKLWPKFDVCHFAFLATAQNSKQYKAWRWLEVSEEDLEKRSNYQKHNRSSLVWFEQNKRVRWLMHRTK